MPRSWYDRHSALTIEDPTTRHLYLSILADKKPYFMRYIYPDLMRQYNAYLKNTNKKCYREFSMSVDELLEKDRRMLSPDEDEFVRYYLSGMPVGDSDCVVNKICRRFEDAFDGYIRRHNSSYDFDYTILKNDAGYTKSQFTAISRLFDDYMRRIREYAVSANKERVSTDDAISQASLLDLEFRSECDKVCSNEQSLCNSLLDICYQRQSTKQFVWHMCCGVIVQTLLAKNDGVIYYPTKSDSGDITFRGLKFKTETKQLGGVK